MADSSSRYSGLATAVLTVSVDGGAASTITYLRRRFIAPPQREVLVHVTREGDRLDLLAEQYLGDEALAYKLCDENLADDPAELTSRPGRPLRVPVPQV